MGQEAEMRYSVITVCIVVLCVAACAGVEVRRDEHGMRYHINGTTAHPEAAINAASNAYTREKNTDEYWNAVNRGQAYPYYGGGQGNDHWFHYGSRGVAPAANEPAATNAPESSSGDFATKDEVQEVREKADDAHERATDGLRMHKRLRDEQSSEGGAR